MGILLATSEDFENACIEMSTGPGELCVTFPGGFTLCAQAGYEIGDAGAIVESMLAQINTALVPLVPFLNVLDVIKAIFDCIQAIPDALGPPPDPAGVIACIPNLVEKVNKLLELIPPFPLFALIKGILNVVIQGLVGLRARIVAILRQIERILRAGLRAQELGNVALQIVVDCANGNLDAKLLNLNAQFQPLNRLLGLVNVLLQLIGVDCIPALEGLAELGEQALAPLDAVIELLQNILAAIPGPPQLAPPAPRPGECA
jgi:hypothetical protein